MHWGGVAGVVAGLVLGFLGAGGTVVSIPILLGGTHLDAHTALGTNALGVALTTCVLFAWRYRECRANLSETLLFLLPGLAGIYVGAGLGLVFPSRQLIFLPGILLFFVAAWILYTSLGSADVDPAEAMARERATGQLRSAALIAVAAHLRSACVRIDAGVHRRVFYRPLV